MNNLILNAEIRTKEERLSDLRTSSLIPAVVYGKHQEPILIKMDNSDFLRTYRKAWESHLINLTIGKKSIEVLVHEIQHEPVSWDFLHIDFYAVTRWEKLVTKIPFNFVWASQAEKEWAIIEELMKEVEVKVLPKDLVDFIEVDISELKEFWDVIKLSDISIDLSKFEVITPEWPVVSASRPADSAQEDENTSES